MQSSRGPLALAFSGGLDTSFCVPRLAEDGWAVHTVYVDTGGSTPDERAAIRRQAGAVGAVSHHEVDARDLVYERFVRFLIQGNVLRGEVYPLSVAAERTQQALSVVETARALGARAVAHGSTGAGNDQVRFDVALRVLAPELEIVTPIRDLGVKREQAIAYLERLGLPVPAKAGAYSINRGLWGTTWGGGWTHDTWAGPPAELVDPPADAPAPREIVLAWERGLPIALDGAPLAGPRLVAAAGRHCARRTASAAASTSARPRSASKAASASRPAPRSCSSARTASSRSSCLRSGRRSGRTSSADSTATACTRASTSTHLSGTSRR